MRVGPRLRSFLRGVMQTELSRKVVDFFFVNGPSVIRMNLIWWNTKPTLLPLDEISMRNRADETMNWLKLQPESWIH